MKIPFSQPISCKRLRIMHISNHEMRRHTRNHFPILGSSSLLVSMAKDFLFYSLDFQGFPVSEHLLNSNKHIFGMKEHSKKNYFFFQCHKMTIFQRLVISREKTLTSLLDSYESLVGLRFLMS